ncbi:hypothetical protein [Dehalococcoides mccartyi]|uniref:hypothetical protein n=1 Tax=Dehalococcoides mccartyi TaxID=61435 RepID=UPI00242D9F6D|nr:hypothetical protein [Dehalococcoides mccartyi]
MANKAINDNKNIQGGQGMTNQDISRLFIWVLKQGGTLMAVNHAKSKARWDDWKRGQA